MTIADVATTRLLTEAEITVLAQDTDTLGASHSFALTEQLLHTLIYWRTQCEMAVKEIGDLRSLTVNEMPNASFVASYREVMAERDELREIVQRAAACSINVRGENAGKALKFMRAYVARRDAKLASELRLFSRDAHLLEPEAKACSCPTETRTIHMHPCAVGWPDAAPGECVPCRGRGGFVNTPSGAKPGRRWERRCSICGGTGKEGRP